MDRRVSVVLQSVQLWSPIDERGVSSKERTLKFLTTASSPFDRESDPSHMTGSAVVLSAAGTLLHIHKKAGIWCGPGGHVDGAEYPWEAAQRETYEETGIKAWSPRDTPVLVHVDVHNAGPEHVHFDLRYLLVSMPDQPAPPPGESQDVRWFAEKEALEVTDASYCAALVTAHGLTVQMPR